MLPLALIALRPLRSLVKQTRGHSRLVCLCAISLCSDEGSLHVSDGHGLSAAPAVPGMQDQIRQESELRAETEAEAAVQTHESCRGQYVPYKCAMPNPRYYGIHP